MLLFFGKASNIYIFLEWNMYVKLLFKFRIIYIVLNIIIVKHKFIKNEPDYW